VALSPIGYAVAFFLYQHGGWWIAGLVGCAIPFSVILVSCHQRVGDAILNAVFFGWLIGGFIMVTGCAFFGGVLIWQAIVAACLTEAIME